MNAVRAILAVVLFATGCLSGWAKPGTRAWEKHKDNARRSTREPSSEPRRAHNRSDWFTVEEADVGLFMNYTGMHPNGEQLLHLEIGDKAKEMIRNADAFIVASVFLFDSMYAEGDVPVRDIVKEFTELLLAKKQANPGLRIAIILDPSHKAYGRRISPSERLFREAGIDVFYSDLLEDLKRASLFGVRETLGHFGRFIHALPVPGLTQVEKIVFSPARIKWPREIDHEPVTLEMVYNALLLKANHRKLLVTDLHGHGIEALISSANPHNASVRSPNHALSVRGEPARYIYRVLREDISQSIRLGGEHTHWHDGADAAYRHSFLEEQLPDLPCPAKAAAPEFPVRVRFVSESRIVASILERINHVRADDEIRIQMFYLSYKPVAKALVRASCIVNTPIRVLLDPNKDSFNQVRDGTPNRQVAHWLLKKTRGRGRLEIRWYSTHGEQNHAKTMCITNPDPARNWLTTGSCNWTGRNMAGVNMEANLIVAGSSRINREFDDHFDRLWTNRDGVEHSLDYEAFSEHAGYRKWIVGEKPFYYSTF